MPAVYTTWHRSVTWEDGEVQVMPFRISRRRDVNFITTSLSPRGTGEAVCGYTAPVEPVPGGSLHVPREVVSEQGTRAEAGEPALGPPEFGGVGRRALRW